MTVSKTTYQFHQVEMKRDSVPFLSKRQFNNPFFQFPCLLTNCFALIIHQSNGNHAQIQIKLLEDCRYSVGVSRNAVFGWEVRSLLIKCFTCIVHQLNRNWLYIRKMLSDGSRYSVGVPYCRFGYIGKWVCLVSCCPFLQFRSFLTNCFTCIIHQSNRNRTQMRKMLSDGRRCIP